MKKNDLSTIIITKNAEKTIAACLQAVRSISDEIIVLDSGSTDHTVAICRRYADVVHSTDWPGFGPQKQRALDLATSTWVLSIDADEVVTPECNSMILQALHQHYAGFRIKRLMVFAGKPIFHSGCSDAPIRLFKKSVSHFNQNLVHEAVIVTGPVATISAPILHYSYPHIGNWIEKMNIYSELGAQHKNKNKSYGVSYAIVAAAVSFIKMFLLKKGFLDGRLGMVASINAAIATYFKYLKLALDHQFTFPEEIHEQNLEITHRP